MMILPQSIFSGFTVLFSSEPIVYILSIIVFAFIVLFYKTILKR